MRCSRLIYTSLIGIAITTIVQAQTEPAGLNTISAKKQQQIETKDNKNTNRESELKIEPHDYYVIPFEANCGYNKKTDQIFCYKSKTKQPITGKLHRYLEGVNLVEYNAKDGFLEGINKTYYINTKLKTEKNYKQGYLDGEAKTYYKNGSPQTLITYKKGQKEGIYKLYRDDKTLRQQGIYIEDKLNGASRFYDKKENLIYEFIYADDQIIAGRCRYLESKDNKKIKIKNIPEEKIEEIDEIKQVPPLKLTVGKCSYEPK